MQVRLLAASLNWKLVVVTDDAMSASLKLATIFAFVFIPAAPFKGLTEVTVGEVMSPVSVVNDQM
jgi:hypothetical protein